MKIIKFFLKIILIILVVNMPSFAASIKKDKLEVKFDNPVVTEPTDQSFVEKNNNHPLIVTSKKLLKEGVVSDNEHNNNLKKQGLTVHYGSRANNTMSKATYNNLKRDLAHSIAESGKEGKNNYPGNAKTVNVGNLYKLKSGPRKEAYLGANLIDFSKYFNKENKKLAKKYIGTEAPFSSDDYFRMITDTKSRILVSLTTDVDNKENSSFRIIRGGIGIEQHFIKLNEYVEFDDYKVECTDEFIRESEISDAKIIVKTLKISNNTESYNVHHIIYKDWNNDQFTSRPENMLDLISAIRESQKKLSSYNDFITVNCGYGYGRTSILILIDQVANIISERLNSKGIDLNTQIDIELEPMIYSLQNELAYRAVTDVYENASERLEDTRTQISYIYDYFLSEKLAKNISK